MQKWVFLNFLLFLATKFYTPLTCIPLSIPKNLYQKSMIQIGVYSISIEKELKLNQIHIRFQTIFFST